MRSPCGAEIENDFSSALPIGMDMLSPETGLNPAEVETEGIEVLSKSSMTSCETSSILLSTIIFMKAAPSASSSGPSSNFR